MTRRMLYLPALIVAAVLMASVAALLAVSEQAEATFPGKNGRLAYESNGVIYTINPDGSGKTKVTGTSTAGYSVDYSPARRSPIRTTRATEQPVRCTRLMYLGVLRPR